MFDAAEGDEHSVNCQALVQKGEEKKVTFWTYATEAIFGFCDNVLKMIDQ